MELITKRFGTVNYDKTDVIWMVREFLGFEDLKRFIIISLSGQEPFKWYQSIENPDIAFLIIDPLFFKPDYVVEVNPKDIGILGAKKPEDINLYVLVSIPKGKPELMSANLKGPVAINLENNQGAQLILSDSSYDIDHSIFNEIEKSLTRTAPNEL